MIIQYSTFSLLTKNNEFDALSELRVTSQSLFLRVLVDAYFVCTNRCICICDVTLLCRRFKGFPVSSFVDSVI